MARSITSGASVMRVGRIATVPSLRWAAAMASMPATVGLGVEEDPSPAVDLEVHVAGREEAGDVARIHRGVERGDLGHAAAVEAEGHAVAQALSVEEAVGGDPGHAGAGSCSGKK